MARDQGYNVGLQATGVGLVIGAALHTGAMKAMEIADQRRQDRIDAQHAANRRAERANHQQLASLARELAAQLAASEAENARLRTALAQRQAYIDRIRGAN